MSQQVKKISHKSSRSADSLSKSSELRLYEKVYNKYIQKFSKHHEDSSTKSHRSDNTQSPPPVILPRRKFTAKNPSKKEENNNKEVKKLTQYQKFVKKESKKAKYRNMSPKSRLKSIGQEWTKIKNKE